MSALKNSNVSNPASSKKRNGGFLRQAKSRKDHPADMEPITEEELAKKEFISPEDVLRLQKITEGELLQPRANSLAQCCDGCYLRRSAVRRATVGTKDRVAAMAAARVVRFLCRPRGRSAPFIGIIDLLSACRAHRPAAKVAVPFALLLRGTVARPMRSSTSSCWRSFD